MSEIQKEENRHLLKRQEKWIVMSSKEVKLLFGYYVFILIISFVWVAFSVLYHKKQASVWASVFVGYLLYLYYIYTIGLRLISTICFSSSKS